MSYNTLHDPADLHNPKAFAEGNCVAKFCSLGLVASRKWFSSYITIVDGVLRLYDDKNTCTENPQNFVMEIPLDHKHRTSVWKRKNYSKNPYKVIDFYCFYIKKDTDGFYPKRELKIGCMDIDTAEKLIRCIEFNTKNQSS